MLILSCEKNKKYVKIVKEGRLYVVKNSEYNQDYIKFINYEVAKNHYEKLLKEVLNVT